MSTRAISNSWRNSWWRRRQALRTKQCRFQSSLLTPNLSSSAVVDIPETEVHRDWERPTAQPAPGCLQASQGLRQGSPHSRRGDLPGPGGPCAGAGGGGGADRRWGGNQARLRHEHPPLAPRPGDSYGPQSPGYAGALFLPTHPRAGLWTSFKGPQQVWVLAQNCVLMRTAALHNWAVTVSVREVGQVESPVYRLLCGGGGWCWILTRAATVNNRKGQTVICTHHVLRYSTTRVI